MTHTLVLLVVAVGAYLWLRHRAAARPGSVRRPSGHRINGAGASADARARELRTPLVRLATAAGITTRAEALARRSEIGAQGERHVAQLLEPMTRQGWVFLADCALPRGNANVDLLGIGPRGQVVLVDAKKWDRRFRLRVTGNRLMHGNRDVSGRMAPLLHEARTVSSLLQVPVVPVVAMVGPMLRGTALRFRGVRIVPAEDVPHLLHALDRTHQTTIPAGRLTDTARRLLPPKTTR
ncbi:NERD domain-containing protein [Streptomyces sp. KAU_LT]|uniref:NERD domain-containing protein n=1 Tax=Streptomyces sp. KAU_LT TaxID=3046669 RepID=UPI0024B8682C|nr:NERD domain-containing protein [Streptomyces sp. KAU_LT]MDI9836248.1 NERD domain-containing protein [Streptomyces sp. KAU_LT]